MKNLYKRGTVYYVRAVVNGKRISQSLETGDAAEAAPRARALLEAARREKWDVLREARVRKPDVRAFATLGEIEQRFMAASAVRFQRHRKPKLETARSYVQQLYNVVRQATSDEPEALPCSILTKDLLQKFWDGMVARAVGSPFLHERAERSAASAIRSARSVFGAWASEDFAGLRLPDLTGFTKGMGFSAPAKKYQWPAQELVDRTVAEGRKLRGANDPLYMVWLLAYGLGLRAREIQHCRRDWFRILRNGGGDEVYLDVVKRDDFAPKSRDHSIRVPASVWSSVEPLFQPDGVALPGGCNTDRRNLVVREFSRWMRSIGWDAHNYPKGAHELRKLRGAIWYTHAGLEAASKWLGDAPQTVYTYYADLMAHPVPPAVEC